MRAHAHTPAGGSLLIADLPAAAAIRSRPGRRRGRLLGVMPARTRYLRTPMSVWLLGRSPDGRYGRVLVPWASHGPREGWISLRGARLHRTRASVEVSLARRQLTVRDAQRGGRVLAKMPIAIGRPGSPTPTGRFWVTDPTPVPAGQRAAYGTYAFGLSGVQTRLPAGWSGDDQLAIHGTGAVETIGQAASAGCIRVAERGLRLLRPLLEPGTPVSIR